MKEVILIIDDNEDTRRLLARILVKAGYEAKEAASGKNAVALIKEMRPDLILLDIVMPEIDGYDVCKNIKNDPSINDTPVIFISAMTDAADKIKGLEVGGADYVTKPFDKGEVIARVRNQLKMRRLTEELVKANRDLTEKQKRLDEDLRAAGGIQMSLLPHSTPDIRHLNIAWRFVPSYLIGGDIFNVFYLDEDYAGLYMVDVSGHGVPSALIAVSVSQVLQPHTGNTTKRRTDSQKGYEIVPPSEVLESLDREYPLARFDKYFTMAYIVIDINNGSLVYSNAGHPYPVLIRRGGTIEILEKGGTIIGMGGVIPYEEGETRLEEGDRLLVYTDGLIEMQNDEGEFFGEERLYSILRNKWMSSVDDLLDEIMNVAKEFGGTNEFRDDLTIAVAQYCRGERHGDT